MDLFLHLISSKKIKKIQFDLTQLDFFYLKGCTYFPTATVFGLIISPIHFPVTLYVSSQV